VRRAPHIRRDERRNALILHHGGVVLAGQQHELPAPVVAPPGNEGRRAVRIAQHDREVLQVGALRDPAERRKRHRPVHLGIDDQPRLVEFHVGERNAEHLAHEAVRAVAGDDMTRIDPLLSVGALRRERHAG
jgi:hypothetical protein